MSAAITMRIWCFAELTIGGCKDGRMDANEDSTASFTCGEYTSMEVVWTIYNDKEEVLFRGSCQRRSCTYREYNAIVVQQSYDSYYYTSSLTIRGIKRDVHILNCSSSSESTVCELRIIGKLFSNVYKHMYFSIAQHHS